MNGTTDAVGFIDVTRKAVERACRCTERDFVVRIYGELVAIVSRGRLSRNRGASKCCGTAWPQRMACPLDRLGDGVLLQGCRRSEGPRV